MATIKSYTDISQSKTLSEILPLESADMHYEWPNKKVHFKDDEYSGMGFSCWSLAALLGVLPEYHLSSPNPLSSMYCCRVEDIETYADNLVDACVAMIIRLNELKML